MGSCERVSGLYGFSLTRTALNQPGVLVAVEVPDWVGLRYGS